MYKLRPGSVSYVVGEPNTLSENEVIEWAKEVARNQEFDITLIFDRPESYEYMDIYQAMDILDDVGEFFEGYL